MTQTEQDSRWLERWKPHLAGGARPASVFAFQQNLIKSQALPESANAKMRAQQIFQMISHWFAHVPLRNDNRKTGQPAQSQLEAFPPGHKPVAPVALVHSSGSTGRHKSDHRLAKGRGAALTDLVSSGL